MRCDTSVGKARRGSLDELFDKWRGPGARRLLAPERVGDEARDCGRDGARDRDGEPGIDIYMRCQKRLGSVAEDWTHDSDKLIFIRIIQVGCFAGRRVTNRSRSEF